MTDTQNSNGVLVGTELRERLLARKNSGLPRMGGGSVSTDGAWLCDEALEEINKEAKAALATQGSE
jgi:hypothetical protein